MSKTVERRLRNDASRFASLASSNLVLFEAEWNKRMRSWLGEIERRGAALRDSDGCSAEQSEVTATVFGVFKKVDRLLTLCGEVVEEKVGVETRAILSHACAQAVARAVSPQLIKVVTSYDYLRETFMKFGVRSRG
jgi:hypothetical protein